MRTLIRLMVTVSLLFAPFPLVAQQKPIEAAGSWEGAVTAGDQQIAIAFDLSREDGKLKGVFRGGPENVSGIVLSSVTLTDRKMRLVVPGGTGDAEFEGVIAEDGVTLKGSVLFGGQSYPFSVKRTPPASK